MKTVTATMDTYLNQSAPVRWTFAEMVLITRKDNVTFGLTANTTDLQYDYSAHAPVPTGISPGVQTYRGGFPLERTDYRSNDQITVEKAQFSSVLDDTFISERDVSLGLFRNAFVESFVVNYEDLSMGHIWLRSGWFGAVELGGDGTWIAEFTPLAQAYQSRRIRPYYTNLCAVQLGSPECGIPLLPPEVERNTAYSIGDFVRATNNNTGIFSDSALRVVSDGSIADISSNAATPIIGALASYNTTNPLSGVGDMSFNPNFGVVDPSTSHVSFANTGGRYNIGSQEFTIRGRVLFDNLAGDNRQTIASIYDNTGGNRAWFLRREGAAVEFALYNSAQTQTLKSESFTWVQDTEYHFEVTRDASNDVRIFIDGTQVGTPTTMAVTVDNSTANLSIGKRRSSGSDDDPMSGQVDDFDFIIGTALHTANFTPPEKLKYFDETVTPDAAFSGAAPLTIGENALLSFSRSSVATRYDAGGILQTEAIDSIRVDHEGDGTLRGWLFEDSRTNDLIHSETFSDVAWTKNNAVASATSTGPDGISTSATILIDNNATGTGEVYIEETVTLNSASDYTLTVFAKADQLNFLALETINFDASGNGTSWFNVNTGSLGTISGNHVGRISGPDANGFYRCSITYQSTTDLTGDVRIRVAGSDTGTTVNLDNTSSIIIFGAENKEETFPSSYVATSGVAATRAADTATGIDLTWFNGTAGTFILTGQVAVPNRGVNETIFQIDDGTNADRYRIYSETGGSRISAAIDNSGGTDAAIQTSSLVALTEFKFAFEYAQNDARGVFDGALPVEDLTVDLPLTSPPTTFRFGSAASGADPAQQIWIKSLDFYSGSLGGEQLFALTDGTRDRFGVSSSFDYNDRIFECTTAGTTDAELQPVYDQVIANTTNDGTAVFTTRDSWTRAVRVESLGSNDRREINVRELTPITGGPNGGFPSGWFQSGSGFLETGLNSGGMTTTTGIRGGIGREIRVFTEGAEIQFIEFFENFPFPLQVGDILRVYPGCDRRGTTCKVKFLNYINFRGFEDIPGERAIAETPIVRISRD